jgi:uncharacterized sulfatase
LELGLANYLLTAFLLLTVSFPAFSAPTRPNILWISAEDISPDLGSYGDGYARSPHLDRLASQGVRFAKACRLGFIDSPEVVQRFE